MPPLAVLRSHGGRWQAIQDGEVPIDIAVIAAPTADVFGNADGSHGPRPAVSLGFALADSEPVRRARHRGHRQPGAVPLHPVADPGQQRGQVVVEVDSIGDPSKIVSGTTRITRSPDRLLIAEQVARLLRDTGILRDGFSFQAGAGGIALAFAQSSCASIHEGSAASRHASSAADRRSTWSTCSTRGLTDYILDGQTFDLDGVRSIARTRGTSHFAVHVVQLPRQGQLRHRWWTPWCWAPPRST